MTKTTWLYLMSEFGPLMAFFVAGQLTNFYTAVTVLMLTTTLAVFFSWIQVQHIPWIPVLSAVIVVVGGGVTLLYEAPDAVIVSDTVFYGLFAIVLGYTLLRKQLILKQLFQAVFALHDTGWYVLTWRWLVLVTLAAIANEVARAILTPDAWIEYRLIKSIAITVFAVAQFQVARKYRIIDESNTWGLRK